MDLRRYLRVDMFDINELQKVYFELFKAGIMHFEYDEFIKHFTWVGQKERFTKQDISDLLSNDMYDKLVNYLDSDTTSILSPLYDYLYSPDLILSNLFRFEHPINPEYLKRYVSLYNEESFKKLKNILWNGADINYKVVSLNDLANVFLDKYEVIILDNILQYNKDISGLESVDDVNNFISQTLGSMLTENGAIQAGYGYEVGTAAFKDSFGIPYNESEFAGIIGKIMLDVEKNSGILIPLVNNYDNYNYDFIPGVEQADGRESDNMVLTYVKK